MDARRQRADQLREHTLAHDPRGLAAVVAERAGVLPPSADHGRDRLRGPSRSERGGVHRAQGDASPRSRAGHARRDPPALQGARAAGERELRPRSGRARAARQRPADPGGHRPDRHPPRALLEARRSRLFVDLVLARQTRAAPGAHGGDDRHADRHGQPVERPPPVAIRRVQGEGLRARDRQAPHADDEGRRRAYPVPRRASAGLGDQQAAARGAGERAHHAASRRAALRPVRGARARHRADPHHRRRRDGVPRDRLRRDDRLERRRGQLAEDRRAHRSRDRAPVVLRPRGRQPVA